MDTTAFIKPQASDRDIEKCKEIGGRFGYSVTEVKDCKNYSLSCPACPYRPVIPEIRPSASGAKSEAPQCHHCGAQAELISFHYHRVWRCPRCLSYCGSYSYDVEITKNKFEKKEEPKPVAISVTTKTQPASSGKKKSKSQKKSQKNNPNTGNRGQKVCKHNVSIVCPVGNTCDTCDLFKKAILT